ncbi:DUF2199 domain-containing protein [Kitasatospora sp. NPDC059648]|uniref:DUF2199 domain-containing protein n=1 Tax=Kitasatospora sp. NPDC059648 TaxID=3346894 RepID=UPI0036B7DDB4
MSDHPGYTCTCCDRHHDELPLNFSTPAPDVWDHAVESDPDSLLTADQCVIRGEHFFVKGLIEIPVIGSEDVFSWGVWVSLSKANFARTAELWETEGRETEPPYFGWLTTELPIYSPSTINLKTMAHTRPVGERPFIELEPTDHPLAAEQREGISHDRVREIVAAVLHPG